MEEKNLSNEINNLKSKNNHVEKELRDLKEKNNSLSRKIHQLSGTIKPHK